MKPLERLRLSQTNRPVDVLEHWRENRYLELNPPYQRGEVWGLIRKRNLIRSILLGLPIPSIIINNRFDAGWGDGELAVIDGKQRITAILGFLDGKLGVPGEWFGVDSELVFYPDLPPVNQRRFRNCGIAVCEGQLRSIEEEQEVFELVNFGGVPQGCVDVE